MLFEGVDPEKIKDMTPVEWVFFEVEGNYSDDGRTSYSTHVEVMISVAELHDHFRVGLLEEIDTEGHWGPGDFMNDVLQGKLKFKADSRVEAVEEVRKFPLEDALRLYAEWREKKNETD